MQLRDGKLSLSPSDVTAYLACEHLTTLSLQVARGELDEPPLENEQAELDLPQGPRARGGLPRSASGTRASTSSRSSSSPTSTGSAPPARPRRRCAPASTSSTRARSSATAGAASPTSSRTTRLPTSGPGATRRSTRSSPGTRSPPTSSSSASTRSSSAASRGASPERIHVLLGNGRRRRPSARRSSPPTTGASARRLEEFVADPPPTEPVPGRPLRHLRVPAALRRAVGRGRPPLARRRIRRRQIAQLERAPGSRPWRRSAGRRPNRPARHPRRQLRDAPQPGRAPAPAPRDRRGRLRAAPAAARERASRCSPTPRRATSSSTSRATRSGTEGGLEYLWGILDTDGGFEPIWADDRDEERARVRALRRPRPRAARRRPGAARLPLRRLRDDGAAPARWAGTARARRSSTICSAAASSSTSTRSSAAACSVSRPGYGLKEMEAFLPFEREAEIRDGGASIVAFEEWMQHARPARSSTQIAAYNEEDCVATRLLRDWLLERRQEALDALRAVPAAGAGRAEADQAGEGRAGGAARGAARDRRRDLRARGAAARLPRPRAQAGLVGVLRPARA